MTGKKRKELDLNNPDEVKKFKEYAKKIMSEPFDAESFPDIDERGVLIGDGDKLLLETEEDCYRQELDEYSPEERREKFKVYTKKKNEDGKEP